MAEEGHEEHERERSMEKEHQLEEEAGGGIRRTGGWLVRHVERDDQILFVLMVCGCMLTCDVAWKFCCVMWWYLEFDTQADDFCTMGWNTHLGDQDIGNQAADFSVMGWKGRAEEIRS